MPTQSTGRKESDSWAAGKLPPKAAAAYLGVHERVLIKFRNDRIGPAFYRISTKRLAYDPADLDAWLLTRRVEPTNP